MSTSETTYKDAHKKAVDPVCGMTVDPDRSKLISIHRGYKYYFCAEGCLKSFEADPEKYLKPKPAKKNGWFGRYLDRMAKINEKEFGKEGPHCCH
jgi:Cu+-exporting ATPase